MAAPIDLLDSYRIDVERIVGECDTHVPDEELERFFSHVIDCFELAKSAEICAIEWVVGRRIRGTPGAATG